MWTAFHSARDVLTLGATVALLVVLAYAGTATFLATVAQFVVLAVGATAFLAMVAPFVVLAVA